MTSPQCMGCGQEIPSETGRLCGECIGAAWDNDGDCWTNKDTYGDRLRQIAREDRELVRNHAGELVPPYKPGHSSGFPF